MTRGIRARWLLALLFVLLPPIALTGCQCWYQGFDVRATAASGGLVQFDQRLEVQRLVLYAPDFYGNGCPAESNPVTSVDFYNGAVKIGSGTKDVNTFVLEWNLTPGRDGIAATGVTRVRLTAVDQRGYRSAQALEFDVFVP
jgi:hypothetical protein